MRLEGKVAIVTGGGRGIGRGIAKVFAKEGAKVVIASRTVEQLDRTLKEIESMGGIASSIVTDVSQSSDVKKMVDFTVEKYGKLDVLVNNAGIGWFGYAIEDEKMEEGYDRLMATNLKGLFMGIHYAVPEMKKIGGGSIINIASVHAWNSWNRGSVYAASKGGIVAGTRALAVELAPYMIRINSISPGSIFVREPEEMIAKRFGKEYVEEYKQKFGDLPYERQKHAQPLPIAGTPEDIGYCAVYLASDESRFVTGINITVDGGATAKLAVSTEVPPELKQREQEMHQWFEQLRKKHES
ncbi:TPA: glucose 1-dehydrogenase [Candidatus Poribacteria bacterium]|nr:glucose 1-dehydrogenase [Candidatus Poribacteria bacterium]